MIAPVVVEENSSLMKTLIDLDHKTQGRFCSL